jgi:hypothetical protein
MRELPGNLLLDALLFWISRVGHWRCFPLVCRRSWAGWVYNDVLHLSGGGSFIRSVAGFSPQCTVTFFVKNTFADV